jgi:uncharacterized membrane protein
VPPGDYPPPTYGAPPSTSRKLDIGGAFSYGWRKFTSNPGPLLICTLIVVAVNVVFLIIGLPIKGFIPKLLLNVLSFIVGLVVSRGLIRAALTVVNGGTPEPGLVFRFDNLGPFAIVSVLFGLMVGIGLVLCIVPGVILAGMFGFAQWFVVERDMDPFTALRSSRELVSGQLGTVILFGLCLILFNVVGAILCGVGLLLTYPVSYLAAAHAFRQLTGTPLAS